MEKQRRYSSHQEEKDSLQHPGDEIWYYKGKQVTGEPVAQPLAHGASYSIEKESQQDTESTWSQVYGSRLHHGQENQGKTNGRSYEKFKCEFNYLGSVHEYHSSSSGSSPKQKNQSGQTNQTEIIGISVINFQDLRAYQYTTAKICVFSDFVLCLGKMLDDLVESWKSKMDNLWNSSGRFSQDSLHWAHPQRDTKIYDRTAVWTWAVQRQDHLHVNVWPHCMWYKRKWWIVCE